MSCRVSLLRSRSDLAGAKIKNDARMGTRIHRKSKEESALYNKVKGKFNLNVRLNSVEYSLLHNMMENEGWNNISGYVRFKLLGLDPDTRVERTFKKKDPDEIGRIFSNSVLELAGNYIYIRQRYDRDMQQLYSEEGVDIKKWISATNQPMKDLSKKTEAVLNYCRVFAGALGLNAYFEMPSQRANIDLDKMSKEELDALSGQIEKELIALGRRREDIVDE